MGWKYMGSTFQPTEHDTVEVGSVLNTEAICLSAYFLLSMLDLNLRGTPCCILTARQAHYDQLSCTVSIMDVASLPTVLHIQIGPHDVSSSKAGSFQSVMYTLRQEPAEMSLLLGRDWMKLLSL